MTSYPDSLFYFINLYSYNEVAIFEGEIKKVAGYSLLTDTATPMFCGVARNGGSGTGYVVVFCGVWGIGADSTTCKLKIGQVEQLFNVTFQPLVDTVNLTWVFT